MSEEPSSEVVPTRVGDWLLERPLGRGAAGEVWVGRHATSGVLGAVKMLRARPDQPAGHGLALFVRERRAIARLSHPHVVALHDVGPDWIVTALVRGLDLARRLSQPMEPRLAVHMAQQLASALCHAHARGVVHRDVKPANVLVDAEDNAWLADFGIALLEGSAPAGSDRAGTPTYAAPEQMRGGQVTPAVDQYALARTMLAMLVGRKPPLDNAVALRQLPQGLPAELHGVLRRGLAVDPADRFPSMEALHQALAEVDRAVFPPPALLATLRDEAPFRWLAGASEVEPIGPDISCARFTLGELEARGLMSADACRSLRERTGYEELGFDLYGRTARLGPLTQPGAGARAAQLVVLLHGFLCDASVWREVATTLCRDHGDVLVLAPDVHGFGRSRLARPYPGVRASPKGAALAADELRRALGLGEVPTLLVGHSAGGAAVLAVGDQDLSPDTHRLALTPVFPWVSGSLRLQLRMGALLLHLLSPVPALRRWVARQAIEQAPENADYTAQERHRMAEALASAPAQVLAAVMSAFAALRPAPAHAQGRCSVVVMDADPVASAESVRAGLEALKFPRERIYHLTGGCHMPQAELEEHPEWTRRNVAALAQVLQDVLARMRGLDPSVSTLGGLRVTTEGSLPDAPTLTPAQDEGPPEAPTVHLEVAR